MVAVVVQVTTVVVVEVQVLIIGMILFLFPTQHHIQSLLVLVEEELQEDML